MKKIIIELLTLLFALQVYSNSKASVDFSSLESFQVHEYDYKHGDNWNEIVKNNSKLFIYYRTDVYKKACFITELYYVLVHGKEKTILGGFNIKQGFFDKSLNYIFDNSDEEIRFRNQYLLGLSIDTLRHPFSLYGIAKNTEGNAYKTEILKAFEIDSVKLSIVKWIPDL